MSPNARPTPTSSTRARLRSWLALACVGALPAAFLVAAQAPAPKPDQPKIVQLAPADAAKLVKETRQKVSVEMQPGLELALWAPEGLVNDPVAIDLDDHGVAYVTSSNRVNMPLDIRGHPTWTTTAHTLKTVDDLVQFYRRELAPDQSAKNTWIEDRNKDGSHDQRDFLEYKERVVRIRDTNGDGIADESRVLMEGFNDDPTWDVAGGILHHDGEVFIGVPPGIYRLADENKDGVPDRRVTISEGYNIHPAFGGHGISGLIVGPDGRIYWEVGDIGLNVVDKTGRRWAYPNQGAIMRSNADGSDFEVFATGIRNLQEFSFDEHGNLISVDNDGDHQGEYERLVYIPNGSDSGWRSNWQYGKYTDPKNNGYNVWMDEEMFKPRHAGQAAHIIPPVAPYHAGPSGMAYNPGTALSEEWRNHFFVSSFPGSPSGARIYAFKLKEDGAGFALESDKVLLRGILTVGMKIGADGALYLTDWVTGWSAKNAGRLWKLDAAKEAGSATRKEVQALLVENFTARSVADVAGLLRHVDMRVRQKAQFELVRRNELKTLLAAASDPAHRLSRIHAIWGIAQLARTKGANAGQLAAFLKDGDAEIRAQAAKMIGDVRHAGSADSLLPLLKDSAPRVRFFAAEALGRIAHKAAVTPLVEMLTANDDRDLYLRHAGSLALSRIGDAPAISGLRNHPSRAVRIAAVVALRQMKSPEVQGFVGDVDEEVATQAARAINDDGGIQNAIQALATVLDAKRFTKEPALRRAINANLRVGTNEALARVAAFAADTDRSGPMRSEAIAVLGVWPDPSPLDRVDGMYIGVPQGKRDSAAASAAVLKLVETLGKAETDSSVKVALAVASGRLGVQGAIPTLLSQAQTDKSSDVRVASLRALQALKAPGMGDVMKTALGDSEVAVRRAALEILPDLPLADAAKVQHVETIIKSGSVPEQQGALAVLGKLKGPEASRALGSYLDLLIAGKIAPAVQVELLEAIQASGSKELEGRLEKHQLARKAESITMAFREGLMAGGEPRRGYEVFSGNPVGQCARCHAIGGPGADVGPELTKIGGTLTRQQLVEALLEPNARIAPGYGTVSLKLKNGQQVDGTLKGETDTHVTMLAGTPPTEQRVAKSEIAVRTDPVSAMPPMGLLLKPREVRDLVEFLSVLK